MTDTSSWRRLIRAYARRYGVDPNAALAVASTEGLSGSVGDAGTSFGPFQLHIGGALPAGKGQAWAESAPGIEYALRKIAGVSRGLTGPAAIRAIVNQFERPANPQAEIARAIAAYGGMSNAGSMTSPSVPPAIQRGGNNQPFAQALMSQIGKTPDVTSLLSTLGETGQGLATPAATTQVTGGAPGKWPGGPPSVTKQSKIIGTPYGGTHTIGNWQSDRAWDLSVPVGTPIYAPYDGVIGSKIGALGSSNSRFAGLRVYVNSGRKSTYLAHLSRLTVKPGQRVRAGQIIGYSGSANGVPHLHVGVNW